MNQSRSTLAFSVFVLVISCSVLAATSNKPYQAEVVSVMDGDTLEVLYLAETVRIRLYGIDSPEKGQPYGTKAKSQLSTLAFSKRVTVVPKDTDQYGRTVADIILQDGTNVNREMVKAGYAWWFEKSAPDDKYLKAQEADAKSAKRGLWADQNPQKPWNHREKKRTFTNDDLNDVYGYKPVEPGSIKPQDQDSEKPQTTQKKKSKNISKPEEIQEPPVHIDLFGGLAIIAPSYWTKKEADEIFWLLDIKEATLENSKAVLVVVRSRFVGSMKPEYNTTASLEDAAKSFDSFLDSSDPNFHLYLYIIDPTYGCRLWGRTAYSIGESLTLGNFDRYSWE